MQYTTKSLSPSFLITRKALLTLINGLILSVLFLFLFNESLKNNTAGILSFITGIFSVLGLAAAVYGGIKLLIYLPHELLKQLSWWWFDPQPTTRIIHPAESLDFEKRKVMFKTQEKNWIREHTKQLGDTNSAKSCPKIIR